MFLLTKDNISEELLTKLANQTVLLETKYGIKQVQLSIVTVSGSLSAAQGGGKSGYIFSRIQGPYLMRTGSPYILHGIPKDIVHFIKNDDYYLGEHPEWVIQIRLTTT